MNADPDPQAQPRARNYEEMTQDRYLLILSNILL